MRLFHFSDDPDIGIFFPRPVRVPSPRPAGQDWLNGPLVWAIEEDFEFLYLFPRECPRILIWAVPETTEADRWAWLGDHRAVAYVERAWLPAIKSATLHRYEMPGETFEALGDAGMWTSRLPVVPRTTTLVDDLPRRLEERHVDLRAVENLSPLKPLWSTTLHTSGIRLRNARNGGTAQA